MKTFRKRSTAIQRRRPDHKDCIAGAPEWPAVSGATGIFCTPATLVLTPAETGQWMREWRQIPTAGRSKTRVAVYANIKDSGAPGSDRGFELRREIPWPF